MKIFTVEIFKVLSYATDLLGLPMQGQGQLIMKFRRKFSPRKSPKFFERKNEPQKGIQSAH